MRSLRIEYENSHEDTRIKHAQLHLEAVSLRPIWAKSLDSYYTKCCKQKPLHLDDLIRAIECAKNEKTGASHPSLKGYSDRQERGQGACAHVCMHREQ